MEASGRSSPSAVGDKKRSSCACSSTSSEGRGRAGSVAAEAEGEGPQAEDLTVGQLLALRELARRWQQEARATPRHSRATWVRRCPRFTGFVFRLVRHEPSNPNPSPNPNLKPDPNPNPFPFPNPDPTPTPTPNTRCGTRSSRRYSCGSFSSTPS